MPAPATAPDVIHDGCSVVLQEFERQHATGRLQVAIFWTLRALLSPALERLILEDRMIYLRECGHAAWLVALFDPVASPRNLAIISAKRPRPERASNNRPDHAEPVTSQHGLSSVRRYTCNKIAESSGQHLSV